MRHTRAHVEIPRDLPDHAKVAARGETPARAAQERDARFRIALHVEPDGREFGVQAVRGGRELRALLSHHDLEDAGFEPADCQVLILRLIHVHLPAAICRFPRPLESQTTPALTQTP